MELLHLEPAGASPGASQHIPRWAGLGAGGAGPPRGWERPHPRAILFLGAQWPEQEWVRLCLDLCPAPHCAPRGPFRSTAERTTGGQGGDTGFCSEPCLGFPGAGDGKQRHPSLARVLAERRKAPLSPAECLFYDLMKGNHLHIGKYFQSIHSNSQLRMSWGSRTSAVTPPEAAAAVQCPGGDALYICP